MRTTRPSAPSRRAAASPSWRLARDAPARLPGIITATRGNHGQAQARAAGRAGLRAVVYVPRGNSPEKNAAMRAFGAELREVGADFDEAREAASRRPRPRGFSRCRLSSTELVRGVATYGLEFLLAASPLVDGLCADRLRLGHLRGDRGARCARAGDRGRRRRLDRRGGGEALGRGAAGRSKPKRREPSPTAWRCGCRCRPRLTVDRPGAARIVAVDRRRDRRRGAAALRRDP